MMDNIDPKKNNDNPSNEDNQEDPRLKPLDEPEELEEDEWENIEESDDEELEDNYELLSAGEDKESQEHRDEGEDAHTSPEKAPEGKPDLMAKLSNFRPNLQKLRSSSNKKTIGIVVLVIIIIIGFLFWQQNSRVKQQQQQVANQVLVYAAPLQDLKLYLGNNLQINGKITGKLNSSTKSGDLMIPIKGTKGIGTLNATVANGTVVQLSLTAAGKQLNVLQDQIKYEAEQAATAALKKKENELQSTFNDAITALQQKNYDAAINGFQASISNKFELAKSYEYLAFSYSQVNQYEQCITAYQQYVLLNPQDAQGYYQMAYCQLHLMQNNNALDNLTKSCTLGYQQACEAAAQINAELSQQQASTTYETTGTSENAGSSVPNNATSNTTTNVPNTTTVPNNTINNSTGIPSNNPSNVPDNAATIPVDNAVDNIIKNLSNNGSGS